MSVVLTAEEIQELRNSAELTNWCIVCGGAPCCCEGRGFAPVKDGGVMIREVLAILEAQHAELSTLRAKLSDEGLDALAPVIHRVFLAFTVCEGDACPVCRNRIAPLLREWRDGR